VKVIEPGIFRTEVRVLDGEMKGRSGFTAPELIAKAK
jgi:hypothetical protein